MDRRKFLQFLGVGTGVAAVAAVAPGAIKFFLPPAGGWKSGDWTYSNKDTYLGLDEFEDRILQPAIKQLSAEIDAHWMKVSFDGVQYHLPVFS